MRAPFVSAVSAASFLVLSCANESRHVEVPMAEVVVATVDASAPHAGDAASGPLDLDGILGRWEGEGIQGDGQSWPMIVEILATSGTTCATAEYPSIPCSGTWDCTGLVRGTLRAIEHLADDSKSRCAEGGSMTLKVSSDGFLDWRWQGSGDTAHCRLRRMH